MKLNLHFNITQKLTLLLVLLATALLAVVGALSVYNGYVALRAAAVSELLATAIEKQAALDVWIGERQADLAALAATPHMLDDLASRSAAPASPGEPAAAAGLGQAVHDHLVADLQGWTGANQVFLALTVIEPEHGQVLASTDPGEEGKFHEDRAYFISGKAGPTVQNPQYSVQGLTMFVAAPLRSADGRLLGVLAGRVNLAEMNAIIARRTGLRQTDDVYLVNTSNLLVTQPRFIADPAVLQRGIHTEAANRCLARNSGVITANDYRGVPAISVYRWLPKTELCLIAELDQAEAFAPSRAFGMTILLIAGLVLFATSALAVALARSITRPVHQLVRGAQEIGRGNLDYRIEAQANDEIGQLATAFNEMAANLRATLGENIRLYQEARAWATELEQRVAEQTESIRASEAELRAIFAAMTDVILVLDCDGRYLEIAPTNPTLLYKPPAELIGKTLREVMPAEQADFFLEHIRRALETAQTINVEYSLPIGDHETWFVGTISPMQADSVIWVARDITEAKRMEEALRENMHFVESIANATPDIIYVYDLVEQRPVYNNRQVAEMLGYTPAEIQAMGAAFLPTKIHPDDWPAVADTFRRYPTIGDGEIVAIEYRMQNAQGEWRWFADRNLIFTRAADGSARQIIGTSQEITARKQAAQALVQKTEELARSNAELEQFAYVASHDLQEPLRMVASYTQLLAQRYEAQLDDRARKYIHYAVDGAVRMQRLINDLLAFSRVNTQGKLPEPTDAHAVLSEALRNLSATIDENQAIVTHDELPTVRADPTQLLQVFQNLIANGIKFRREDPPQIHITASDLGDEWRFSVQDNGIGIDPKYASRLFVIFQRLHSRQEYPGTGIGLAVCKRIVERHGGEIWFESEPGKGTTFYFTLPK